MRLRSALLALLTLVPPVVALAPAPAVPADLPEAADVDAAVARANALLDAGSWLGKSPRGWIQWGQAQLARAPGEAHFADLAAAVEHLYETMGVDPTEAQVADLRVRAATLDADLAQAFGGLVRAFDMAYEVQRRDVAAKLDWAAVGTDRPLLPAAAAEAGVANADALLGAVATFRATVEALPAEARAVPFSDPLNLVVLGGPGDETFTPLSPFKDPAVLVDLGGNDLDLTSAGGACPELTNSNGIMLCNGLAAALRVDLGGDDRYLFTRPHEVAQGSGGLGGLGILVDTDGVDVYTVSQSTLFHPGPAGLTGLAHYLTSVAQGSGEGGNGVLLDLEGNDIYQFTLFSDRFTNWAQGQGFGGVGGTGALLDAAGDDTYGVTVNCPANRRYWCGAYVQGTALYPGLGFILDAAGADRYNGFVDAPQEDYYAQGFAAFGGLAIQVDMLGDDRYFETARSRGPGSFGVSLNCAYGTAFYGGAFAAFLDLAGDDSYISQTIDFVMHPSTMSEGFSLLATSLYWDVAGNDRHEMRSIGLNPVVSGRGTGMGLVDTFAVYLDTGGVDVYADTPASQTVGSNNAVWPSAAGVGVDWDLVPSVSL